jgi:adenylyltransferase/sulfurtransferase
MRFRELELRKDPACPLCGEHPTQHGLVDYDELCGVPPPEAGVAGDDMRIGGGPGGAPVDVTPRDLSERLARGEDLVLVDVREPEEWRIARLPDAVLVPLRTLPARLQDLDRTRTLVLYCHHGTRSRMALDYLAQAGFERLQNLRGGIDAWSRDVDPSVPRY